MIEVNATETLGELVRAEDITRYAKRGCRVCGGEGQFLVLDQAKQKVKLPPGVVDATKDAEANAEKTRLVPIRRPFERTPKRTKKDDERARAAGVKLPPRQLKANYAGRLVTCKCASRRFFKANKVTVKNDALYYAAPTTPNPLTAPGPAVSVMSSPAVSSDADKAE